LTARGDKALEERRIRPIRSENRTQSVESQSTESSPKTRGPWYSARYQHQPTKIQPIPDQSNSRLPVRLASPMIFYQEWIRQQGKVPPDRTPSVPVNAQPSCPVRVELNNEDVNNRVPASAVRLQAESTPVDSTGSNQDNRVEFPSVSPVTSIRDVQLIRPIADGISAPISQAGEPSPRIVRADTVMSASNHERRPDDDRTAYRPCDEAIYSDVRVEQVYRDSPVSHNGVPVASESYNDVLTSQAEVRVQGASPPTVQRVLLGRAKGRTTSTPSAKFVYACIRRSDTASFRSTVSTTMKSKVDMILEDLPSPSRSEYASRDVEFSNNPAPVLQPGMRMSSQIPSRVVGNSEGQFIPYKVFHNAGSTSPYASSTKNSMDNRLPVKGVRSVKPTDKKFAYELYNYGSRPIQLNYSCVNKTAERQVPFPWSNHASMCVGRLTGRYGNTAKQWEKTDRTLRQTWIGRNQSAASDFSQSATPPASQSQLRKYTLSDQSETSNPGSFCYKSHCRSVRQFCLSKNGEQYREEHLVINWISSRTSAIEHSSSTPIHRDSELLVEQTSSMFGDRNRSAIEHSSSMEVNHWSELLAKQPSSTPGSETESTIEHSSSTPTKFAELNLDVLASVLMDQLWNSRTADKVTQVPEKQPHVCFVRGHEDMGLAYHRRHMLSFHKMDLVGIAVVYDDNLDTNQ